MLTIGTPSFDPDLLLWLVNNKAAVCNFLIPETQICMVQGELSEVEFSSAKESYRNTPDPDPLIQLFSPNGRGRTPYGYIDAVISKRGLCFENPDGSKISHSWDPEMFDPRSDAAICIPNPDRDANSVLAEISHYREKSGDLYRTYAVLRRDRMPVLSANGFRVVRPSDV